MTLKTAWSVNALTDVTFIMIGTMNTITLAHIRFSDRELHYAFGQLGELTSLQVGQHVPYTLATSTQLSP
nr:hypothetical protein [Providencia stuartii]